MQGSQMSAACVEKKPRRVGGRGGGAFSRKILFVVRRKFFKMGISDFTDSTLIIYIHTT